MKLSAHDKIDHTIEDIFDDTITLNTIVNIAKKNDETLFSRNTTRNTGLTGLWTPTHFPNRANLEIDEFETRLFLWFPLPPPPFLLPQNFSPRTHRTIAESLG